MPSKKPALSAPVLPLALMMTGLYLVWFGVKYWEDTHTIWPSDPVKRVLQSKGLPARTQDVSAAAYLTAAESSVANAQSEAAGSTPVSTSAGTTAPSGPAQSLAKNLLASHNWGADQMSALIKLWTQESGWDSHARNSGSGAFGIAQALGHGTANSAADDGTNEYGGFGLTDAQAKSANSGVAYWQIVWGLNYIAQRYGSPDAAWGHEQTNNWY